MSLPVLDKQRTMGALGDATHRLLDLVATIGDGSAPALGVWTVADLVAHVAHNFEMYPAMLHGEGSPVADHHRLPQAWKEKVAAEPDRDLSVLAGRIVRGLKAYQDAVDSVGWTDEVGWHGGIRAPVHALCALTVSECEMHGLDLARASGAHWRIEPDHARLAVEGHLWWMPHFVDEDKAKDVRGTVKLMVRGGIDAYFVIDRGALEISLERPSGKVDCYLSVDAVGYLMVGYGRLSPIGAALRGKSLSWGTKPFLALRLATIFRPV